MRFANVEPQALGLELPWQRDAEQEERFKRLLKRALAGALIFALLVPWLPVFEKALQTPEETVVRTRMLMEPLVQPEPEPEPIPAPEPLPVQPPTPAPTPEPTTRSEPSSVVADRPPAPPPPPPAVDRESVMREQGLVGLDDQFSALRGNVSVAKLQRRNVTRSDMGQQEYSTRDRLGQDIATQRSDGIQVDHVMTQNEVSLADYRGVSVQASAYSDDPGGSQLSYLSGQSGRRDMENIRRTFEAAKSSVYSLYIQALNENPNLGGKFIFRLVIEPDGSISELELVSSELGVQRLERTILDRIRNINFGAQNVSPTAVEYAFSFLPS